VDEPQVSTWWPVAPSARAQAVTYTRLPVLDDYANKHWNGLVRDCRRGRESHSDAALYISLVILYTNIQGGVRMI
jgi:hypothetical protein